MKQINKLKIQQTQDQEFLNSSLYTLLITLEEIYYRECQKLQIKQKIDKNFQYLHESLKSESIKTIPELYDDCLLQLKAYARFHRLYLGRNRSYSFPKNLSKHIILFSLERFNEIDTIKPYSLNLKFIFSESS